MSFAEPPSRRERLSRLPAFAQYEDRTAAQTTDPELRRYPGDPGTGEFAAQTAPWDTAPLPWERPQEEESPSRRTRVTDSFGALPDEPGDARRGGRGFLAGSFSGLLAAALSLGVANLVAAYVRPQASPIIAVGGAFIDRTPPWLKNFAVATFGVNDKNVLLLGMYTTIALLAMGIGMIAWRHVLVGVVALALFGAFGAFVAFTRPESQTPDIIPSIAGGVAGIAAIVVLVRAGHSRARFRTDRGY